MSRLVLHIGTHKTATTSIQKFFDLNRTTLAERGIFYPDYSLIGRSSHYAHHGAINGFSNASSGMTSEDARAFLAAVRERRADYDVTIISAEPMYRHLDRAQDKPIPRDPDLYWPLRKAYIERLADAFGPAEVVVAFREQADYAQSLYQEHIKATRYTGNMVRFRKDFWFHFDFLGQAEAWEAVFPGVTGLSYAHLTAGDGAEMNFARAIGLDLPPDLPRAGLQNQGMLPDLVILKRMLNQTELSREALNERIAGLMGAIREVPGLEDQLRRRTLFRDWDQRQAFRKRFSKSNEILAKRFLRNVPEGADPLPPPDHRRLRWSENLHPELVDLLTARAVAGKPV